jgi:uncharacterized phage-associated protein
MNFPDAVGLRHWKTGYWNRKIETSTMRISFCFNPEKAIQTIAYLLGRFGGPIDKVKLIKLLYLADREAFIQSGVSITSDRMVAMKYGPVPSGGLDLLNGLFSSDIFSYIHLDDNRVELRSSPGENLLSDHEKEVLDNVANHYGKIDSWELVRLTHELKEYQRYYIENTSNQIPYEAIASAGKNKDRFRMHRPVINSKTSSQMPCPFNANADESL